MALGACRRAPEPARQPVEFQFVRGGVLCRTSSDEPVDVRREAADEGGNSAHAREVKLGNGRRLIEFDWRPGETYRLACGGQSASQRAPRYPAPAPIWQIELEDVSGAAAGGASPDCVVAFAPDSRKLAIGSFGGWLRIVDCLTGRVEWSRRLAEGMVKRLAWSPQGDRLYAGEQSPDARLWAFDVPSTLGAGEPPSVAWSVRLAEQLETSRPPAHDRFGIYTLPAVYDLSVTDDGRVFVAGTHRWMVDGQLRSRSLSACYLPDGSLQWQFPPTRPTDQTPGITFMAVDRGGERVALLAAEPTAAAEASLVQLDGQTGQPAGSFRIEPLAPHFERVESWDSISIGDDGAAILGLNDGRALLFTLTSDGPHLEKTFALATPLMIGNMPIAASASYARFHGDVLCLQAQNTHIPFGSPQAANRPPLAHPGANTLTVCDRRGEPLWIYRGPFSLGGSWTDRAGSGQPRWLAVACREQPGAAETENFGFLLFDLEAKGGGNDRLVYYYPTEGPTMFFADVSGDGRFVAVVETPTPTADGRELYGTYQVHIVH